MEVITLEEHFTTPRYLEATASLMAGQPQNPRMQAIQSRQLDLSEGRLKEMDEAGIDRQVLSFSGILLDGLDAQTATEIVQDANDRAAEAVRLYPKRFAAFAAVSPKDPERAAKELRRCVEELGFCGVMIDGTTDDLFLDDPRFAPIFETAQQLEVPLYLHPAPPPRAVQQAYYQGLPQGYGQLLSIAGWGWHVETGLHVLRLIVAGVFERYPRLQIIIGHMGENLPFSLARADAVLSQHPGSAGRSVTETFLAHFHVTTSGYFTLPPFLCALMVVGADRLMFSVDYPFSTNTQGRAFLDSLPISAQDREKIAGGNARRLLKLDA